MTTLKKQAELALALLEMVDSCGEALKQGLMINGVKEHCRAIGDK